MTTYQQLVVMPGEPHRHCCREFSLCCCQCCLGVSVVFTIVFIVVGAVLVPSDLMVLGVVLLILGGITFIFMLISAACVCCITPKRADNAGVIVVNHPVVAPNSPPQQSFTTNPAFDVCRAPLSLMAEAPPSYEVATQEKI